MNRPPVLSALLFMLVVGTSATGCEGDARANNAGASQSSRPASGTAELDALQRAKLEAELESARNELRATEARAREAEARARVAESEVRIQDANEARAQVGPGTLVCMDCGGTKPSTWGETCVGCGLKRLGGMR